MGAISQTVPRRLVFNSAAIFGGEAVARLATFLMAVVIAHRFGSAALGEYGFALAFASVLLMVPDFGLHLFTTKELAAEPERLRTIFWSIHCLKLFLLGGVVAFTFCFGEWGIKSGVTRILVYLLTARVLLQTFSQASMAVFKAFEQMHYVAMQQLLNSAVVIAWIGLALAFHADLAVIVLALVAGQAAETLLGWRIIQTKFSPGPPAGLDRKLLSGIMLASFPIGITAILQALNLRIDILVLSRYVPKALLGQFQAAAWFAVAAFLVTSLLMTVVFPKIARLLRTPSPRGDSYVKSLLKNGFLLFAIASLVVWLSAPSLLRLCFGAQLTPAASVLRMFVPIIPLVFLNTVLFYVFVAAGRRTIYLGALSFGVVAGIALQFGLAPHYGPAGSALADLIREFLVSAIYLYFLDRERQSSAVGSALLKVFMGATALLAVIACGTASTHYSNQWPAAWMLLVFAGTLLHLGFPRKWEWRLLTDDSL